MRKICFLVIALCVLLIFNKCGKPDDFYSADFLNAAELAKPGKVDSLQILPGRNRAILKFIVAPDRRVNKLKIAYSSSLSAQVNTTMADIAAGEYGNYKEVAISNLPEATLLVNITSYDSKGDSSNTVTGSGFIYGDRYNSSLYNRIYQNITTINGVKQLNFQNESAKPRDTTVFYTLQKTIVTYSKAGGGMATIEVSPFANEVKVPDIATTGTIRHYSIFKPVVQAIDIFQSAEVTVSF